MANSPLNILILGKDRDFFLDKNVVNIGDTRARHIIYAEHLDKKRPGSEIRVITYSLAVQACKFDHPARGLSIYGTSSYARYTFLIDVIKLVPKIFAEGWRPDVITVQTPWEEGVLGFFLAKIVGAKFIPQLHFDLFSKEWIKEHWMNRVRKLIAIYLMRRADRVRVVSSPLKEKLIKVCGINPEKIKVAPVGVNFNPYLGDPNACKEKISTKLDGCKVILFVGRLCSAKNLDLWLNVARKVLKKQEDVAFLIAGEGDQRTHLLDLARQLNIDDRVIFLGPVKHEELPQLYAAADLFLLTSFYEGFGRVVLEAMLAGVPVVSTKCTGPEELIQNHVTGLIVDAFDEAIIADAVLDLLNDPSKAIKLSRNASAMVKQKFSLDYLAEKITEVWECDEPSYI